MLRGAIREKSDKFFQLPLIFLRGVVFWAGDTSNCMSSPARAFSPDVLSNDRDIFFWIRPVDEKGLEVDGKFAEAAYEKARDFRMYRAQDLGDEAIRAELVEKAVYAASRARSRETIRDVKSYVFATFARLVDERIRRDSVVGHKPSSEIDQYAANGVRTAASAAPTLDDIILQQQILEAMSPEDRLVWKRRLTPEGLMHSLPG
jgi:hypothetical protein